MRSGILAFSGHLLVGVALAAAFAMSGPVLAQEHGVGVGKVCPLATKPGDLAYCELVVRNEDGFGDTIEVIEFWDIVDPGGPNQFRHPAVGNLPIISVSAGVSCAADPDAPIGLTFPCLLPGTPGPSGSGEFVRVKSEYIVPATATNPLLDQGNVIVRDLCNAQPIGCNPNPQQQQFGAAVSLFFPSIDVSKTGPDLAKVGDTVTYTIGFTNTTTGTGFPGFSSCTGFDDVLGNLGEFQAGVPRQFDYTIQPGDPNPLVNTATIDCGVNGFDNIVSDSDSHSLETFDASVLVTKTGPELAKAGDTVTYTVNLSNTSSPNTPALSCTAIDSLVGPIADFDFGDNSYQYTIPADAEGPILNEVTVICDIAGFDNQVGDDDSHSLDLFDPSILVTKTGPELAKVGDTVTYTVSLINTSSGNTPALTCTAIDSLVGPLPGFGFGDNTYDYTIPGDAEGPIVNSVVVTCDIAGFDNQVGDADSHSLDVFDPSVVVTKTGPELAKVGDTVTYTVNLSNTSSGNTPALSCTAIDSLVGPLAGFGFGDNTYEYTIPGDAESPIVNSVVVTCDIAGFDNQVGDDDSHSLDVFDPSVSVTKTGPELAKAGDTVTYTVNLSNTSSPNTPALSCTAIDSLIGPIADFDFGDNSYQYTIPADAEGPILNEVTVTCDIAGFDNQVGDDDSHSLDVFDPSVVVTKSGPELAKVGDTVTYTVNLSNTSSGNTPALSCTAIDSLVGPLAGFDFGDNTYHYTIPADAESPIINSVSVTCDIAGFDNQVGDDDSHSLDVFDASVVVTKTGPELAKAGDTVTYTINLANTSSGNTPDLSCTAIDSLIGPLADLDFGDNSYDYTIPGDAEGPIVNEVTVTCDIAGFDNQVGDDDSHSLDLFDPSVVVTKSGPELAKAGDTVTYTINLANTSSGNTPDLSCTAIDSLIGPLADFDFGDNSYDYTIPGDAEGPIVNEVSVTCDIAGFDNQVGDEDSHSLDLISPSVSLSKICQPDPVEVGGVIEWLITVSNTGDAALDCLVNDPDAGIVDEPLLLQPGDEETLDASRIVTEADVPLISNTATVMCEVDGFDNQVEDSDTADCEVTPVVEEICRTPGFWGTHAGTEHPRSTNLTQMVIDAGGPLSVCGATIDNTNVGNVHSAVEAMCVRIQGESQRQLARQLTAMALNCIVSGGSADCAGTSVQGLFADANEACAANEGNSQLGYYIDRVDCFNNGGQFNEGSGQCLINDESNCQMRDIDEATSIFDGVNPLPGPAGSPRACREANGNGVKVVPAL